MELTLDSPVRFLPGVGPVMADRMETLGINAVADLLYYAPFRYDDYSLVSRIAGIQPGEVVTVSGRVDWIRNIVTKKGKRMQQAMVSDDSGSMIVIWFNQPFLTNILHKGAEVRLAGPASWFSRSVALISPSYEVVGNQSQAPSLHTGRLVPVYPETEGLSSKWLRGKVAFVLENFLEKLPEFLPEGIRTEQHLMPLGEAIRQIHYPESKEAAANARERLAFDELFLLQLAAQQAKAAWITHQKAHAIVIDETEIRSFMKSLPFVLTGDQEQAVWEITGDLARSYPANRLLLGDVGSGKTVVAAAAMYAVYRNGLRSLLMAPTEILASQHYKTLTALLAPLGMSVGFVTGSQKAALPKNQEALFSRMHTTHDVLVGTHALLSAAVDVKSVGLTVIDEQQRFGVRQRALLRKKSETLVTPHLLTMTATPIPRTIALTILGNLAISTLKTMPYGRKKVKTWVVGKDKRADAYRWIIRHVQNDHGQVFILCPLIEESESMQTTKAATAEFQRLKKGELKSLRLGLLHGRMKPEEKQLVLAAFRNKEFDVLVATPVVEVGIDIPGATVMMVEAADRFGLGQLHQLRGRVGRNDREAYCFIFTENEEDRVLTRLKALETTYSGPELAELDLALRGPGEVFGTRQHGLPTLKFASFSDTDLIKRSGKAAEQVLQTDVDLANHPLLSASVKKATIDRSSQD